LFAREPDAHSIDAVRQLDALQQRSVRQGTALGSATAEGLHPRRLHVHCPDQGRRAVTARSETSPDLRNLRRGCRRNSAPGNPLVGVPGRFRAAATVLTAPPPENDNRGLPMAAQTIWIGTRKGAFVLRSDERRKAWKLNGPQFLGHVIHHIVQDPRNPKSILMGAKTGHL